MNTEETLTAFGTVILVIAVFSVIVFVLAKITQYQRSRQARKAFAAPADVEDRTQWSDDAFGVPAPPPLTGDQPPVPADPGEAVIVDYSDPVGGAPVPAVEADPQPPPPLPPPPLPVPPPPPPPVEPVLAEEVVEPPPPLPPEPAQPADVVEAPAAEAPAAQPAGDHWVLGSSPFLPTPRGGRPTAASIQRRYWQNLAASNSSEWLGKDNLARLAEGKPPSRINRRTGRSEELQAPPLNEPGDEHTKPRWPSQAQDPFAGVVE